MNGRTKAIEPDTMQHFGLILEVGHTARLKDAPTEFGASEALPFTHEWEVWVRNPDEGRLEYCVQKVVFTLQDPSNFNKVRVVTKPPYVVSDQCIGSFPIIIDIHFKSSKKSKLEKTRFCYDLTLQPVDRQLSDPRFQREFSSRELHKVEIPAQDKKFKGWLLKGGARIVKDNTIENEDIAFKLPCWSNEMQSMQSSKTFGETSVVCKYSKMPSGCMKQNCNFYHSLQNGNCNRDRDSRGILGSSPEEYCATPPKRKRIMSLRKEKEEILIPDELVGQLIGARGYKIKKMKEHCWASFNISTHERLLTLTGSLEDINQTKREFFKALLEAEHIFEPLRPLAQNILQNKYNKEELNPKKEDNMIFSHRLHPIELNDLGHSISNEMKLLKCEENSHRVINELNEQQLLKTELSMNSKNRYH